MRTIAAFAVVAAVLMAIGVVAAELVREDPPKILFRRPVIDAGVRGDSSPEPAEGVPMHATVAGFSAGEV
jgi:hypothetical protein